MDLKPIPPSGQVADLRKENSAPTPEDIEAEKQAKREKVRRNLRIIALCLAAYYFASAFYSWYEESQHEANAVAEVNLNNPLQNAQLFRDSFNTIINSADTSLPIATANDTSEGFVAVLSTALELQGHMKPQSKELQDVQIQTRYPDAFPPESILAFRSFVLACERLANPAATQEQADQLLSQLSIVPQVDANEDNKVFPASKVRSQAYEYSTTFTSGPIDELTLIATPLANLSLSIDAPNIDNAHTASSESQSASTVQGTENNAMQQASTDDSANALNSNDVPVVDSNNTEDVPTI